MTTSCDRSTDNFDLSPLGHSTVKGYSNVLNEALSSQNSRSDHELGQQALQYARDWSPLLLTRKCLTAFIGVWISFFIVLAVLFTYSQANRGLSTADDRLYYLWTYGPTAVLSVVSAPWAQVVYRMKQLMPWKAMATGHQTASKSVLLDYISPLGPVALYRAVSNSHHTVTLSILSSFVMLALTVSSTGLFSLQYAEITRDDATMTIGNRFDFQNFDWDTTDSHPAALAYATSVYGLQYPAGTTARFAVQDFSAPSSSNGTLISVVDVFSAYLDCEPAVLVVTNVSAHAPNGVSYQSGGTFTTNITNSNCTISNFQFNSPPLIDESETADRKEILAWGYGQLASCAEDSEIRILVSTGNYIFEVQWNETSSKNYILALPYDKMFQIINSSNILCRPGYAIEKARVTKWLNSTSSSQFVSIEPDGPSSFQMDENQAAEIARSVFQSLDDPQILSYFLNGTDSSYDTFFSIIRDNGSSPRGLDELRTESNALYGSIAAQIAALKLFAEDNNTIHGQIVENTPRLFVRALSFAIMETSFVILVGISAYFLISASNSAVSHDPGSIHGLAIILKKSPDLVALVNGKECFAKTHFDASLQDHLYRTSCVERTANSCELRILAKKEEVSSKSPGATQTPRSINTFWEPLILQLPIRILVILLTLTFIAVLEVLVATSQSRNGIVSVDTNSWLHYGWTYLPALSMIVIGTAYDSANTSIKLINPYATMHERSVSADLSIADHPLSRIPIHQLFTSGKQRQIALFLTSVATLLASLLPIAVSGLYTPLSYGQAIKIHQLTAWNFSDVYEADDTLVEDTFRSVNQSYPGDAGVDGSLNLLTDLIATTNLSYPPWTYGELAFPLVNARTTNENDNLSSLSLTGTINVTIPAVRGALNCSMIPHEYVDITYPNYTSSQKSDVQVGNYQCLTSTPKPDCNVALFSMRPGSSLGGCSLDPIPMFLPLQGEDSQPFGFFQPHGQSPGYMKNHTYCPIYVGIVGTTTNTSIDDYNWFACSTEAERVHVHTTFALPEYKILAASANENTAERLVATASATLIDDNGNESGLEFTGPNSVLFYDGGTNDPNKYLTHYGTFGGQNFDNFFSCLVHGRDSVPASTILGQYNTANLFEAVQHLWRVVLAQQLRTNSDLLSAETDDIEAWAPTGSWNGTLYEPDAYRLKQSIASTRILQGLLTAMALCGILAFISLGHTKRLLPNNPSSIAVVASLLAGSEFLCQVGGTDRLTHETGEGQEAEATQWSGYLFSLGWWDREDGERRFGIDIGKADLARLFQRGQNYAYDVLDHIFSDTESSVASLLVPSRY